MLVLLYMDGVSYNWESDGIYGQEDSTQPVDSLWKPPALGDKVQTPWNNSEQQNQWLTGRNAH